MDDHGSFTGNMLVWRQHIDSCTAVCESVTVCVSVCEFILVNR